MRKVKQLRYYTNIKGTNKLRNRAYLDQYLNEASYKLRFILCFNYLFDLHFKDAIRVLKGKLTKEERNILKVKVQSEFNHTTIIKEPKIGRNVLCPCGSGRKYKHCCGKWK